MTSAELERLTTELTATAFRGRVNNAIDSIIASHPGETVAAVCHGGVISTVLADLLEVSPTTYFDSHYTSVTRIKAARDGRKSMVSFNECHWLREL